MSLIVALGIAAQSFNCLYMILSHVLLGSSLLHGGRGPIFHWVYFFQPHQYVDVMGPNQVLLIGPSQGNILKRTCNKKREKERYINKREREREERGRISSYYFGLIDDQNDLRSSPNFSELNLTLSFFKSNGWIIVLISLSS